MSSPQVPPGAAGDQRGETNSSQQPCIRIYYSSQPLVNYRGNLLTSLHFPPHPARPRSRILTHVKGKPHSAQKVMLLLYLCYITQSVYLYLYLYDSDA